MPVRDGEMRRLPPYLVDLCRQMRRAPTGAEAWLWQCLRARRLGGYKFRRQRPLDRYIADFCCNAAKLIVELDGGVHERQREYDATRDQYLALTGHRVLRIPNARVFRDPEGVLQEILAALTWEEAAGSDDAAPPPPSP